jgi:hypothetical protein
MCNEVLTEKLLAPTAVVTVTAQLGIIGDNAITYCEALDCLTKCCDCTGSLMSRYERKLGTLVRNYRQLRLRVVINT